jgi:hypothetical protein
MADQEIEYRCSVPREYGPELGVEIWFAQTCRSGSNAQVSRRRLGLIGQELLLPSVHVNSSSWRIR